MNATTERKAYDARPFNERSAERKAVHTPTPWRRVNILGICKTITIADADHITRCVNSHDELLALARDVAEYFDCTDAPMGIRASAILERLNHDH